MTKTSGWTMVGNRALELVLGLGLLLIGLFRVLFPILGVTGPFPPPHSRQVGIDATARIPDAVRSGGAVLRGMDRAELYLAHPDLGQRLSLVLPGLVGSVLVLVILQVLLDMSRTFGENDFFRPANTRRLVVIAVALLLIGVLVPALDVVTTHALVNGTPAASAVRTGYDMAAEPVFLALLVGAAAGALRTGIRLRAETDGLV